MRSAMTFEQWRDYAVAVDARAQRVRDLVRDRAKRMCQAAELPFDGCCLHNCAISEIGTGWAAGAGGKERRAAARRIEYLLNNVQWEASRIAASVIKTAWDRIPGVCH
jgi:hypothetical protein